MIQKVIKSKHYQVIKNQLIAFYQLFLFNDHLICMVKFSSFTQFTLAKELNTLCKSKWSINKPMETENDFIVSSLSPSYIFSISWVHA